MFCLSEKLGTLNMDRLTNAKRLNIVKSYYKNGYSHVMTFRALRGRFGAHNRRTTLAIGKI